MGQRYVYLATMGNHWASVLFAVISFASLRRFSSPSLVSYIESPGRYKVTKVLTGLGARALSSRHQL